MLLCGLTDKDLRRICRSQYEHPGSAICYWPEMCLGHLYIVLEPIGSARLTFDDDLYYELCDLMTEVCSESRMRSRTWRGVSKWSRGKDWYIGRLHTDTEMVPKKIGDFSEYREATGTPGKVNWAYWAIVERGRLPHEVAPPKPNPNWTRGGGAAPLSFSLCPLSPFPLSVGSKGGSD